MELLYKTQTDCLLFCFFSNGDMNPLGLDGGPMISWLIHLYSLSEGPENYYGNLINRKIPKLSSLKTLSVWSKLFRCNHNSVSKILFLRGKPAFLITLANSRADCVACQSWLNYSPDDMAWERTCWWGTVAAVTKLRAEGVDVRERVLRGEKFTAAGAKGDTIAHWKGKNCLNSTLHPNHHPPTRDVFPLVTFSTNVSLPQSPPNLHVLQQLSRSHSLSAPKIGGGKGAQSERGNEERGSEE